MCKTTASTLFPSFQQIFAITPPGTYAYWVRQATHMLRDSWFGNWQGTDSDGLPDFLLDKFDHDYWEWVDDPTYIRVLQVKAGKQAADAIVAILNGLSEWRIDCDHTVQISNLYAVRMMLGAAKFGVRAGPQMRLRDRESSGLTTVAHYGRDELSDPWRTVTSFDPARVKFDTKDVTLQLSGPFAYAAGAALGDTTEQLVDRATAGSRVRWTNLKATGSDAFRHENCVKLGTDLYAAGGLDDPITGNEFTRDRLEIKLASITNPAPTRAYINSVVFIDEIEMFEQL